MNILVKNITRIIFEEAYSLLWNSNIENILEICNDNERDPLLIFKGATFLFLEKLIVHDYHITIEDSANLISACVWNGVSC